MSFADIGKTKRATGSFLSKTPTSEQQDVTQMLEDLGYGKKESLWTQLGRGALSLFGGITNVLRTGEYAVGGLLKEGNPLKGIQEQISPSEAIMNDDEEQRDFWSKENLAGFVIDTLLDPVTYLSFGTSGIAKLNTKGGSVAINKVGTEFMEDMISKGVSNSTAQKALAKVIKEGGEEAAEKYIGKSGLKFMGKIFVPAEQFETAGKLIGNVPILGETLNKVGKGIAKAFVPFSEIDQLPASMGGKGRYSDDIIKASMRQTEAEVAAATEVATRLTKEAVEKEGADVGKEVAKRIEKGVSVKPNLFHGTTKASAEMIEKEGFKIGKGIAGAEQPITKALVGDVIYFTEKPDVAKRFARTGFGKEPGLVEVISSNLNIADLKDAKKGLVGIERINDLKKRGFDGLRKSSEDIAVWSIDKIKTKTQSKGLSASSNGDLIDGWASIITESQDIMWSQEAKIRKEMGKSMGKVENYIRHSITKDGIDFLGKTKKELTSFLPKPLKAKLDAATGRTMKGTITEINEYMLKNHGVKKFFEDDAFKLFAQRSVEHVKYMNAYKLVQNAKQFGIDSKGLDGIIQDGIKFVKSTNPLLKGKLLPEPIAKHLDSTVKILTNEESMGAFMKTYDKLLGFWKKSVTGMFPAFHTRNALGGTFNNYLGWQGSPTTMLKEYGFTEKMLKGIDAEFITKSGKKYSSSQLLDLAKRFGVKGQTGQIDVLKTITESIDEITASGIDKLKLKASSAPLEAMGFVEDRLRLPLFLNGIREGLDPAEAAKKVFKYHFDYNPVTGLTDFERLYMKRLMPFYTWTRNNVPLQIEQIMKQPGKYAGVERVRRTLLGDQAEDMKSLPSWMNDQFTFPVPFSKELGKSLWVSLDLPFQDINRLPVTESGIRAIASQLTPFLKFPLEKFFNRNMFFGGEIVNPDLPAELQTKEITGILTKLPEPLRKFLGIKKVSFRDWSVKDEKVFKETFEMSANNLHILQSFLGRYLSTMDGISKEDVPAGWKASKYLGGVPIREVDIGQQQAISDSVEQKQYSEIVNYLKQHKVIPYATSNKKTLGLSK